MSVSDWSTTAANNTTVGPVNIAEGCPAGNMNNAIREVMAQVRAYISDTGNQPEDPTLTGLSALATGANQMIYATGSDTFAMTSLSAFMRGALASPSSADAGIALNMPSVDAVVLGQPGGIRFRVGASAFVQVAWGALTVPSGGSAITSYALPFPNASFPVCSGADASPTGTRNLPAVIGGSATTVGFSAFNSATGPVSAYYIAVGY